MRGAGIGDTNVASHQIFILSLIFQIAACTRHISVYPFVTQNIYDTADLIWTEVQVTYCICQ